VGKVAEELVGSIDLMPTLLDMTGRPTPGKVQGKSLLPLMRGRARGWREVVFSEGGYPGKGHGVSSMARTQSHKYVRHTKGEELFEELFDLERDRWERENEIGNPEYAGVRDELLGEIEGWKAKTDHAPMYPMLSKEQQKEFREHPERRP
jgi:arylsulfatase A-like enzyme